MKNLANRFIEDALSQGVTDIKNSGLGALSNSILSDGISIYFSKFSSMYPDLFPFQKYVTWPNFCVSEIAKDETPSAHRYWPRVLSISGGSTKKCFGICWSPSYSIIPV